MAAGWHKLILTVVNFQIKKFNLKIITKRTRNMKNNKLIVNKKYNSLFPPFLFSQSIFRLPLVCLFCFQSVSASAFSVWAVNSGDDPSQNSAGNILQLDSGSHTIDLYFDTGGDVSWGWDVSLLASESGLITNVSGGDINGGFGLPLLDGYRQLGGDASQDLNGGPFLMFSFDALLGNEIISIVNSSFTSGSSFQSESITSATIVSTSVPLSSASWLLLSALGTLVLSKRSRNLK